MFFAYLRARRRIPAVCAMLLLIFTCVFALCAVPLWPVLYAALLIAFFLALLAAADFCRFRRRHLLLMRLAESPEQAADTLPEADSPIEADYQQLLCELQQMRRTQETALRTQRQDMMQYYTTWVHQIKTPIAAMRLLLQERENAAPLLDELQKVEEYTEMALCYQRLHTDSSDFVIRACALDDVVRQALRRCASQFILKKIQLCYEPLHCTVLTDEKWLLFVIGQVLSNALKYTPAGSVHITLEAPKTLCIRDTGIGIDPADLPRVFEMGYTGINGRADKRATGIGLGLCRQIMTRLGHRIAIESAPGHGTAVRLFLESAQLEVE